VESQVKRRLVGLVVLVVAIAVAVPLMLSGSGRQGGDGAAPEGVPDGPDYEFKTIEIPLEVPEREEAEQRRVIEPETARQVERRAEPEAPAPAPAEPSAETAEPTPETTPEPPSRTAAAPEPAPSEAAPMPDAPKKPDGWVVQVGSFGESDNAFGLRDRLRKAGFSAFVEEVTADGNRVYRVRVGPEQEEGLADNLKQRLAAKMDLDGLVMRYP